VVLVHFMRPSFTERRTRGLDQCCVAKNPGALRSGCHFSLGLGCWYPNQKCHPDRSAAKWRDLLFILRSIQFEWKRYPFLCHPDRSVEVRCFFSVLMRTLSPCALSGPVTSWQGLKPGSFWPSTARLKSCPDRKQNVMPRDPAVVPERNHPMGMRSTPTGAAP
jgi:hypothetical protein